MASKFQRRHKRKPSFFKVLIHDFSTILQIPPSFIKEFGKDGVPKRIALETYNGECWQVGVEKLGNNKFCFNNGWDKFVQVNSLEIGDFLLLKYFADCSKFKVKIYGKSCCEKQLNVVSKPLEGRQEGKKRKSHNQEDDDEESKAFKSDVINLENDNSSSSFDDDEEQEFGGTQKRKAKPVELERNKKYGEMPADHHNLIKFETKNPSFQFQLCYSTANFYLHIPIGFFKEHMKENKRIKLEVSERTWNLEIHVYERKCGTKRTNEARVTRGWKILVEEHQLKMGDVCIFEMVNKCYDSDPSLFHVHVYRWDHQKAEFHQII
ncbi:hypothetical protein K1719_030018 [Acacia pycnantha]|nr:hypothetical protein K1719_030018 [Acacia pycnantha]